MQVFQFFYSVTAAPHRVSAAAYSLEPEHEINTACGGAAYKDLHVRMSVVMSAADISTIGVL